MLPQLLIQRLTEPNAGFFLFLPGLPFFFVRFMEGSFPLLLP